ncbi:cation-transporting ATPase I [Saccharopolyspora erythraea NRRL 2338]|uniref:Cation-transporting ATPase, E1-E2 family n=3 Tax=Saccharopolyspora erythraea TaxID=1836 RepID=A4FGA4_SACEN|nr:cation-translocating P-type ATPase [Saccharopolyspora erythraea]PFG96784.1 cation-transporting ATPase I [Saccharopolyspora erythraea NRRL 2338]QRK87028.1 cation-translocating P-type ATPase [Saccharopolyspora erythraea]CAM03079.1 cation-transporting ATPase, E1-E2 family [Saccharopolyspora erythraea NRRL 2338]
MALGRVISAASQLASPVWDAVRTVVASPSRRRMFAAEDRTHLDVRGLHRPGTEALAGKLEVLLQDMPGVRSAEVNGVLGRIAITYDPETVTPHELADAITDFEQRHDLDGRPAQGVKHPGDAALLLREVGAVGLGIAGLGYAMATSVLPVRALPSLVPVTFSLVGSVPWMRSTAEKAVGRTFLDTSLAAAGLTSQALAQRPLGLFTDTCERLCTTREYLARREAWRRWEQNAAAGAHRSAPVEVAPRPVPLPDGAVERVANTSGALALGGYGAVLAISRLPQRALATLAAGVPRPGSAGREAFAAQVASALSHRGNLVLDPDALRRLDRVDAVVFDAAVLRTGRDVVDTVLGVDPGTDITTFVERANELIDPADPRKRERNGAWSTMPLADCKAALPSHIRDAAREESRRGGTVVVLLHDSEPVAIASVAPELDPLAEALVDAARGVGTVAVAGIGGKLGERLEVDRVVAGGSRLAQSVRDLQAEGRVVAVVSFRAHSALLASDVGIGLPDAESRVPWGAHVSCINPAEAHTLLAAVPYARRASNYAAALSVAGSCAGAAFGALGPAATAPSRASMPVQAATLCALGTGTWTGIQVTHLPPPSARARTPWHALPVQAVLALLGTSPRGLDEPEAARRKQPVETDHTEVGVTTATIEGLINPMTAVLGVGAAVSAGLGSFLDAGMIMFVLGASAVVDGVQRVSTNRELAKLLSAGQLPARLRRDGTTRTVPADQLVPGDIVELHAGDGVPADCRVLEAEGVELDESSLTGESQLVAKSPQATGATMVADRTSMLYQGTVVASGRAIAVVVATGSRTELGSTTTQDDGGACSGTGGVEARLSALTKRTIPISAGAGVALAVADLVRGHPAGQAISRAVGLAVAAVPEGLPFVATVAETAAARRLADRGVLVRSPKTIEALGRVDALCFDKTGTLTQGRISLREVSDGRSSRAVEHLDPWLRQVVTTAVHASPEPEDDRPLAHPTDQAVVDGAQRAGIGITNAFTVLADLPFEPSRGYHAVRAAGPGGHRVSVKGAPEVVLGRCVRWLGQDGERPFDRDARVEIEDEVERLAQLGYRVLAVAERSASPRPELDDDDVADLDFYGLLALADPVHPTAAEAVGRLSRAGVDVIMITGDHPSTAEAIAVELDMLRGRRVVNGAELDAMDDDELTSNLPKIAVFARVSPSQKARIVRSLRQGGRVVAMTGDGANDVPAIKLAQVGIALGSRATPAAREAADLVIADDRIETISDAIVEGRGMWASVHDALSILLGGNLGEIAFTLGAGLLGTAAAPNTRQLLVVNLLTDVLPALAIAVRPPPGATPEQLLSEGPEVSLGAALNRDVYVRAAATAGAAAAAWLLTRPLATAGQARTAGLVALVSAQLGQTMAMRGRTPLVLLAGAASMVVLAGVVQVPGVSQFFGSSPLLAHQWLAALTAAAVATVAVWIWQLQSGGEGSATGR